MSSGGSRAETKAGTAAGTFSAKNTLAGSSEGKGASKGTADHEKQVAAAAAVRLVEDGMTVGLGTGTTVAHVLAAIARRGKVIRCVATSPRTEEVSRRLGLRIEPFGVIDRFDLAIDGADQVAADGWLIKGGGAAHTREKIVAATADRFVVVVDSSKPVDRLAPPIPLELLAYGVASTLRRLAAFGRVARRDVPPSPDGGVIADFFGPIDDPAVLAPRLAGVPGVVEHGLFPPTMVSDVVIARGDEVEWRSSTAGALGTERADRAVVDLTDDERPSGPRRK